MTKRILTFVFSLIFAGSLTFAIVWGVVNFNKVKGAMAGTEIHNAEDMNKAYEDGYNTALKDKAEYDGQIVEYRDKVALLNDTISQLNSEVTSLNNFIAESDARISTLNNQRTQLEAQVVNLSNVNLENENTINELNFQIASLVESVDCLQSSDNSNKNKIAELNSQISNLQALSAQLQTTNQLNSDTITALNTQIIGLNNQVRDMSEMAQNANAQVIVLNNRAKELQSSVDYYESYIATHEDGESAVATYEVNGSVSKIEIVTKGSTITLMVPDASDSYIFNGWRVNGTGELLGNTYVLNNNTKFIADLVCMHTVKFMNGDQVYDNQTVYNNEHITMPVAPSKDGYEFLGWSLNGVDVVNNIETVEVLADTTYYAVYVRVYTVTFMADDQVVAIQYIRNGKFADDSLVTVDTTGVFEGWE